MLTAVLMLIGQWVELDRRKKVPPSCWIRREKTALIVAIVYKQ